MSARNAALQRARSFTGRTMRRMETILYRRIPMSSRRTADVARILKRVNFILAQPDNPYVNADFRRGVASLLESILMDTGNYEGFGYLQKYDPDSLSFDETKRVYYVSNRLRGDYESITDIG